MATFASKTGHSLNPSTLDQQNDKDVTTGVPSSFAGIVETVDSMNNLINQRKVKMERVAKLHPGYLPDQYQNSIDSTKIVYGYAQQGWVAQNFIQFEIQPKGNEYYNPSTMKLTLRMALKSANGVAALPANIIPVENFERKLFNKVKIENVDTKDDVNNKVEYTSDLLELADHFFLDRTAFNQEPEGRNQSLCQSIGRRLVANATNARLEARRAVHATYRDKQTWEIDLSKIDNFFKINRPLSIPIVITLYFETNQKKLFEAVPTANIAANAVYNEPAKIVFTESFTPQISYGVTTMSAMYVGEDQELFEENKIYDLGEYPKITVEQKSMQTGAQNCVVFLRGLQHRINFLAISIQSLTGQEHGSVYDSTLEDRAMSLIDKFIIKNIYTPNGIENRTYTLTNDIQHRTDLDELYAGFRRFCTGAPVTATNHFLKKTDYLRNFPTKTVYLAPREVAVAAATGCYPIIVDLTDSKGIFDGENDNQKFVSPLIEVEIVFKQNAAQDYNVVLTAFQKGNYVLKNEKGLYSIKKV